MIILTRLILLSFCFAVFGIALVKSFRAGVLNRKQRIAMNLGPVLIGLAIGNLKTNPEFSPYFILYCILFLILTDICAIGISLRVFIYRSHEWWAGPAIIVSILSFLALVVVSIVFYGEPWQGISATPASNVFLVLAIATAYYCLQSLIINKKPS